MTAHDRFTLSAKIGAPPAVVWALIRRFGDVGSWNPFLATSRIVAGKEESLGAEREVTTADGAVAREQLVEFDDERRALGYRMLTFPMPVLKQHNRIVVAAGDQEGLATVLFSAEFEAAPGTNAGVIADINRTAFTTSATGIASYLNVDCAVL